MRKLRIPCRLDTLCKKVFGRSISSQVEIVAVAALNQAHEGVLTFSTRDESEYCHAAIVITKCENADLRGGIRSEKPRLDFARALQFLIDNHGLEDVQSEGICSSVTLGDNVVLGRGVKIGAHTTIGANVVIADFSSIGSNCIVKPGAVIGDAGFGFERDESGQPIRLPHIGTVSIGNSVEIGSSTTINRGTFGATTIGSFVKLDDQVHVAHNVCIGDSVIVAAGATIGGSVSVGDYSWVGLGASIRQKIQIGKQVVIGVGSNVITNIGDGHSVMGYTAKKIPLIGTE